MSTATAELPANLTPVRDGHKFDEAALLAFMKGSDEGFVPPVRADMPAPDATSHRGLALMQALVDHVEVSSDEAGTTVILAQSLAAARTNGNGDHAAR